MITNCIIFVLGICDKLVFTVFQLKILSFAINFLSLTKLVYFQWFSLHMIILHNAIASVLYIYRDMHIMLPE